MTNLFNENTFLDKLSRIGLKKHLQKKRIIRLIYEHKTLSVAELISIMNLSSPSILSLLEELSKEDLIENTGSGNSSGGRRPSLYGLKPNSFFVLGIDIGLYSTRMAIFNSTNENITNIKEFKTCLTSSDIIIDLIHENAQELISSSKINPERLIGVGVDMPGLIDIENGINYSYLYDKERSLRSVLEEKFLRPVYIMNDAQAKALAELRFGLARGKKNVIVLNVSSGLGTGLIFNGQVYHGTNGFSGEFSHTPYIDNGILCSCGKKGCLETVASGLALKRRAIEGLKNGVSSIVYDIVKGDIDAIESKHVVEAVKQGDQFSIGLVSKVGYELGKGTSVLVQTLNPELIIVGGRVSKAGDFLTLPMEQALNEHTLYKVKESVKIVSTQLGNDANLLGAVAYVIENILEN